LSPDVLARKLAKLRVFLSDLRPYEGASIPAVEADHYRVERLLQLLVEVATDILAHELANLGVVPASYRDAVRKSVAEGLLPEALGESLERAAGLRNVLVHLYEELDMEILTASVEPALNDFGEFLELFQARLEEMENG
jgi:uncharacterized protein YutE (UPF0331/DUF86 family)